MSDSATLCQTISATGKNLARGLQSVLQSHFGDSKLDVASDSVVSHDVGRLPENVARSGLLILHRVHHPDRPEETVILGWFMPQAVGAKLIAGAKESAESLAQLLPLDGFACESTPKESEDLWSDYLGSDLPAPTIWQRFQAKGCAPEEQVIYLAMPVGFAERIFGDPEPVPPVIEELEMAPSKQACRTLPPRLTRLLRTRVPVIVTLAHKQESAAKIMELGPGSIIEFDRSCDEPLQMSVNNLPVGLGEAVKVGDHFGLKVLSIVAAEERVARLGTKWPY